MSQNKIIWEEIKILELKEYKNYKELCPAMSWKVSAGNTKKAQIKDLDRYCKYHKQGNSFVIDEIFQEVLPKIDNKGNSKYNEYIEKLIIHMLSTCPINKDTKTINMSRNGLYLKLHMINKNYNYCRNNIEKLSRQMQIPINCIYDFYNNTSTKLKDNVERTLNRLQSQCLIKWEYRTQVKLITGAGRLASDYEVSKILKYEREALLELDEDNKQKVLLKGKWSEFSSLVKKKLQENTNILYYYKVFHVNTCDDFIEILLQEDDKELIENELNAIIYLSSVETSKKKHRKIREKYKVSSLIKGEYYNNPRNENEQIQIRPEYIADTKAIAHKVIDWDCNEINLEEVSNEKYTLMEALCDNMGMDWDILTDDSFDFLL